jgi:hypothetical protein
MLLRLSLYITIAVLSTGCSSAYKYGYPDMGDERLDPSKGVLISTPKDGYYAGEVCVNSSGRTARTIEVAFSEFADHVDTVSNCQGIDCLSFVDSARYGYYINPKILHWEERATEWSGKSDQIKIQIIIYNTITKEEVARGWFSGKSKWATLGGDHPQDLLPEPASHFVRSLYKP